MVLSPLIFTDLDGTLLDHFTYSFQPAEPFLRWLQQEKIEVVPNTSKTRAELEHLCAQLSLSTPFVCENGAAVYAPKADFYYQGRHWENFGNYWRKSFSLPRSHWVSVLDTLSTFIPLFTPFSALSLTSLIRLTGLNEDQARRARIREFGEPVVWHGNEKEKGDFIEAVEEQGGKVLQGGRFLHVGGKTDKGVAMNWLQERYRQFDPAREFVTIALGDSDNDVDMLEAAEYAVVIRSPIHSSPELKRKDKVYYTDGTGPAGWVEGLEIMFRQLGIDTNQSLKRD